MYPSGVTIDGSGNIYVTDNHRAQKFSPEGNFITQWRDDGRSDGQFRWPHGVVVDRSGNIYVIDTYNNRLQKFSERTTSEISLSMGWNTIAFTEDTGLLTAEEVCVQIINQGGTCEEID